MVAERASTKSPGSLVRIDPLDRAQAYLYGDFVDGALRRPSSPAGRRSRGNAVLETVLVFMRWVVIFAAGRKYAFSAWNMRDRLIAPDTSAE